MWKDVENFHLSPGRFEIRSPEWSGLVRIGTEGLMDGELILLRQEHSGGRVVDGKNLVSCKADDEGGEGRAGPSFVRSTTEGGGGFGWRVPSAPLS